MDLQFGAPGQILPPADRAVRSALRMEEAGYDAVWWPDHLMGWHPDSIWTEDVTPLARHQPSSHVHLDPFSMMAVVGAQAERLRVGSCVTDLLRRHPAAVAHTLLTLDHVTRGKAILGVGTGERLNTTPYGIEFSQPVAKLSEGLDVIRLLLQAGTDTVDYEGQHFRLKDAVMGLDPFGNGLPEIWLAAHGPRMLRVTGEKADGWLPTKMSPERYAASLADIRRAGADAGRDMDGFTPGMLAYILVGPDEAAVQRLVDAPLTRFLCILLPNSAYEQLGVEPPLGKESEGFHHFIPSRTPRAEGLRIVEAIPPQVVRYYAFAGTVEQLAEEIAAYHAAGLRHLVMWNITGLGDPELARFSFDAMRELKDMLAGA
jgi:phthiodiolone/phenolphthiodiolone dimycocerosates ketoreductase